MKRSSLIFPFLLALISLFFSSAFFPTLRLIVFAPFLAITFWKRSFFYSLWIATLSGLMIDLLTTELRFGIFSLSYCLTALIFYGRAQKFHEQKLLSLTLFSVLIAAGFSFIHALLLFFFHQRLPTSFLLLSREIFLMSIIDAFYAFFWFTCPLMIYNQRKKIRVS